ncbi:MAG: 4-hydroxy-3-methylbut-2-enyl diphosphate reductase [Bacteroidales bacterium]|nr:4-hydroxy-3-methylbut-2-enyl diphosphate reductase [Bacteroidales bacterium]MCB8998657.1 4-hydroxy-3-methylbut-2-enyl diphosphate reductase [Bacteroidales bacterium]MCB9012475.1 4-hydroxy-3-methylbut-2-enyl diphosphate reductase [Bacteroidales bacterium]
MKINIEEKSGFCYGVVRVIEMAEGILDKGEELYCLGQIVHNELEVERLVKKGLKIIEVSELHRIKNSKILFRAHGEPPSSYEIAERNGLTIIDGTCPIVNRIQKSILSGKTEKNSLIVVFGKKNHPEVQGLLGQIPEKTQVISSKEEVSMLPESQIIHLYSQTTMDKGAFNEIAEMINKKQNNEGGKLILHNTICGHVSHRRPGLQKFAAENDLIIFVGGKYSSNGKILFQTCLEQNPNSFYIGSPDEIEAFWLAGADSVGIAGATSTPHWQINDTKLWIEKLLGAK